MVVTALDRAEKEEAKVYANLAVKIKIVNEALQQENAQPLTERAVKSYVLKLEDALALYEDSVAGLYAAAATPEDEAKKTTCSNKLIQQLGIVNPLLDKL